MAAATFEFEIVTPDKMLFASSEATYVGFRALSGNLGIKAKHLPIISTLDIAPMKVEFLDGSVKEFAVCGGFLEMNGSKCTVLATIAEPGEDIDRARAEAAKERAEQRLHDQKADTDMARAELALKRALTRLRVSKV
ncbi:MAG: ATP synthase F1 subunit epsilon [Acidaminococcaceae bacterium]|nr:ATP synthase F1 subunit epsilon [Acidaminococcaceae bacterium]